MILNEMQHHLPAVNPALVASPADAPDRVLAKEGGAEREVEAALLTLEATGTPKILALATLFETLGESHREVARRIGREYLQDQGTGLWYGKPRDSVFPKVLDEFLRASPAFAEAVLEAMDGFNPKGGKIWLDRGFFPSMAGLRSLPKGMKASGALILNGCHALKALPDGLSVGALDLVDCPGLVSLPEDLSVQTSIRIGNCPNLESLGGSPLEYLSGSLVLGNLHRLVSLPESFWIGGDLHLNSCLSWDGVIPERGYVGGLIHVWRNADEGQKTYTLDEWRVRFPGGEQP